jgi:DNA integrity scanning protein DisA with diadenylate cyclase activity
VLTSLFFQAILAASILVLVVVFQEDIRRVFERIALWGTFRERRRLYASPLNIDTLIEVASTLASQKVGALIVLKGKEPIDRHVDGGILLGGRLSKPLLYSLFDPHSPGHDGAAWIEADRLVKFSVHLPLSKNAKAVGHQGTRHAAALGLSERSDALVLVVSEEYGTISAAENGILYTALSAAELKERLEHFYRSRFPRKTETPFKQLLREDFRLKGLSVVLAAFLWLALAYQPATIQRTFVVPIEYRNLPRDGYASGAKPTEARVTLSGSERAFNLLNPSQLILSLDLSPLKDGQEVFALTEESLRCPFNLNLSVYRIEPSEISLKASPKPEVQTPSGR